MRFCNAQYLEKEVVTVSCRNNNATLAILDGQPVFLQDLSKATNFGVDVTLTSDANFSSPSLFAGIAKWSKLAGSSANISGAQVGDVFEAVAYGFTDVIVARRSRAASTDSWATMAAIAVGDQLKANTVNNYVERHASDPGVAGAIYPLIAAEAATNTAGSASSSTNTALVSTQRMKAFVRAM